jgi:hypothetical protein
MTAKLKEQPKVTGHHGHQSVLNHTGTGKSHGLAPPHLPQAFKGPSVCANGMVIIM